MNMDKTITEQIEEIKAQICDHFCKYPDQWDEEKEGRNPTLGK